MKADEQSQKEAKRTGQSGSRCAEAPMRESLLHGARARSPSRQTQPKRTATPGRDEKEGREKRMRELLFPPVEKKALPATTSTSTSKPTVKSSVTKSSASQSKPSQANIPSSSTGGMGKFDQQPAGAVSRQAQTEQQIKKTQFKRLKQPVRAAEENWK